VVKNQVPVVVAARVSSDVEAAHILDVFNGEVAKFKQPKDVIFVNGLPRNAIGKIVVGEIKNLIQSNYWM
jgi:acyl-coenzyme A synthetase/AMP-(fatty) acid ligase